MLHRIILQGILLDVIITGNMKATILLVMSIMFPSKYQRAMWVVANTFTDSAAIRRMVEFADSNNIGIIFAQVERGGYAFYRKSKLLPIYPAVKEQEGFDPLEYLLSLTKPRGIQVHAWMNAMAWWTLDRPPKDPKHLYYTHPDWFVVDDDGRSMHEYSRADQRAVGTEARFLDPRNPGVQEFLRDMYAEVAANYDVDGVHFDFIRYPGPKFGYAKWEREEHIRKYGIDPLLISDGAKVWSPKWNTMRSKDLYERWMHLHYMRWNYERKAAITKIIKMVHDTVKKINPNLIVSAAVFPNPASTAYARAQDWATWLEKGYLDWACPMAYTPYTSRFERYTRYAIENRPKGKKVFMGIGIWFNGVENYGPDQVEVAEKYGADGVVLFSYNVFAEKPELGKTLFHRRIKRVDIGPFGRLEQ